jgi:hypothetical protein
MGRCQAFHGNAAAQGRNSGASTGCVPTPERHRSQLAEKMPSPAGEGWGEGELKLRKPFIIPLIPTWHPRTLSLKGERARVQELSYLTVGSEAGA